MNHVQVTRVCVVRYFPFLYLSYVSHDEGHIHLSEITVSSSILYKLACKLDSCNGLWGKFHILEETLIKSGNCNENDMEEITLERTWFSGLLNHYFWEISQGFVRLKLSNCVLWKY